MENQPQSGESSFARLSAVNVAVHLERKGEFSYLSWPFAVAELRKLEPTAKWEVIRHDGLPYLKTECGYFVEVAVTVGGLTLSQLHPVLDGKNRPIWEPTCFDINTSIQRALVKAIALHGLGLSVYAGEDLVYEHLEAQHPRQHPQAAPQKKATQLKQVGTGLSKEQQDQILKLIEQTRADLKRLLDFYNVDSLDQIRASNFDRVVRSLQHRRAA